MCRTFQNYRDLQKINRGFEDIFVRASSLDEETLWIVLYRMIHGNNLFYDVNSYLQNLGAEQIPNMTSNGAYKGKVTKWFNSLKERIAQLELLFGPYFVLEDEEE